ncbi:hypothetical protein B0H11DRAFT_1935835 [Mycena galericulata]|nr:hypothetical protein B0H11DRAFT_1935835 [Mycena galericulata]
METERIGGIIDLTLRDAPVLTDRHAMEWLFSLVVGKLPVSFYFCWGEIDAEPLFPIPRALRDTKFFHRSSRDCVPPHPTWSRGLQWLGMRQQPNGILSGKHIPGLSKSPPTPLLSLRFPICLLPLLAHPSIILRKIYAVSFPPVERHSGQKEGEDIHAFMARRKALNEKLAEKENSEARSQRLARELHGSQRNAPGKKGARVFHLGRGRTVLSSAGHSTDRLRQMTGTILPNASNAEFPDLPDVPETLLPEEENGQHSTADDLQRTYDLADETDNGGSDDSSYEPYHDMREVPYSRFGFTQPIAPAQYEDKLRPDFCSRSLGDEDWPGMKQAEYTLLPALFAALLEAKELEGRSSWLVGRRRPSQIVKQRILTTSFDPAGLSEEDQRLCILLRSAATTLQIVRMGWGYDSNLQEIVHELLGRGVEFRLCTQAPAGSEPCVPIFPRQSGLGFRPAGYHPTSLDYRIYCRQRDNFLASPRGRAARFAGGIIGRLARDVVFDDRACLGPTERCLRNRRAFVGTVKSSTAYWDDALTPQEIDLICGAYILPTGMIAILLLQTQLTSSQDSPLRQKRMAGGPPDCERWFQKRVKLLEKNQAPLWTQTQWKHKIRFMQKSRDVALANERIAANILALDSQGSTTTALLWGLDQVGAGSFTATATVLIHPCWEKSVHEGSKDVSPPGKGIDCDGDRLGMCTSFAKGPVPEMTRNLRRQHTMRLGTESMLQDWALVFVDYAKMAKSWKRKQVLEAAENKLSSIMQPVDS